MGALVMLRRVMLKTLPILKLILISALCLLCSCQRETQVERANQAKIFLMGNSAEPKALDHQLVTGVPESNIIRALFEGLAADHPSKDDVMLPGAAVSWQANEDLTEWEFQLQPEGRWSDGEPVTAHDFQFAYHRILHPDFAGPYADMLYALKHAEDYNRNHRAKILVHAGRVAGVKLADLTGLNLAGDPKVPATDLGQPPQWKTLGHDAQRQRYVQLKGLDHLGAEPLAWVLEKPAERFSWPSSLPPTAQQSLLESLRQYAGKDLFELAELGVEVVDDYTLRLKLREPVPYLPSLTRHYTWFPVPKHVVLKFGKITDRFTAWSLPPNLVGNGPFRLKTWRHHDFIEVERNPYYWDAAAVQLNGIRFLPIENSYTETRAFLSGQLHSTYSLPADQIKKVAREQPDLLRQEPYVGTVFVRVNTTRPGLSDPKVRQAMSLSIDREMYCEYIAEGYQHATTFTPHMGDYIADPVLEFNPEKARALLAEAGYPNGDGFPRYTILISRASARPGAEALQAMWKKHLNILVSIQNLDWGSYISVQHSLDYDLATAGWIGDYLDPTTFLNLWTAGNGNNNTGWSDPRYDALLRKAAMQADQAERYATFREAEKILMEEQPILPIAWYARNYLHRPEAKGWYALLLDNHPWKYVRIED